MTLYMYHGRSLIVLTFNSCFIIFRADDQNVAAAHQENEMDDSLGILNLGQVSRDSDRGLSFSMLVGIRLLHSGMHAFPQPKVRLIRMDF